MRKPEGLPGPKPGTYAAVSRAAIFDLRLSANAIRVLAALATYADKYGQCYPAIQTVATRLSVGRKTVERGLNELEQNGYLRRENQLRVRGAGGGKAPNRYWLLYPEESNASDLTHRGDNPRDTAALKPTDASNLSDQCVNSVQTNASDLTHKLPHRTNPKVTTPKRLGNLDADEPYDF